MSLEISNLPSSKKKKDKFTYYYQTTLLIQTRLETLQQKRKPDFRTFQDETGLSFQGELLEFKIVEDTLI